jgi:phosphoenolpyruvate-protein phosphotransferase (PTS system enzyme I)
MRTNTRYDQDAHQITGIGVSFGIVIGPALVYDVQSVVGLRRSIDEEEIGKETGRFRKAVEKTREEMENIPQAADPAHVKVLQEMFLIQVLMLNELAPKVEETIATRKLSAESAWFYVLNKHQVSARAQGSDLVRRGIEIVNDLGQRLMQKLTGRWRLSLSEIDKESIIIAHDLSPSDTAEMQRGMVLGFVTEIGGRTSHTAIMARSLEIPAVVAATGIMQQVSNGVTLIVDGRHGTVIIGPDEETLEKYRELQRRLEVEEARLQEAKSLPAETIDGHIISIWANIETPDEAETVIEHGASGIGLYRTEFLYLNRSDIPNEEIQYQAYRKVAESVYPNPVVIRTLDLGGDKFASQLDLGKEMNPFLGLRAIRFCLERKSLFRTQLRAILRASVVGNIKMMFPMISSIEEMLEAREFVELIKDEIRGVIDFDENMPIGAMIEIPSAVLVANEMTKYADFFSIGTNDLVQYTLAVDRINDHIAYLYEPLHPAVLRLIAMTVEAGRRGDRQVSICGEMAADPLSALILLGFGIDHLSMSPVSIPQIKDLIRSVTYEDALDTTQRAMKAESAQEVREIALETAYRLVPDYEWES